MKYWKGKIGTDKVNQYGTMDNNGYVPDSIIIEKYQYDILKIINKPEIIIHEDTDIQKLIKYAKIKGWV